MTAEIKDWTIEEKNGKKYVKVTIFIRIPGITSTLVFQTIELDSIMCDTLLLETWGDLLRKGETDLLFPEWIKSIDRNAMIESMATPRPATIDPDESTPDLPF